MLLAQRAALDREVLGKGIDQAAVHRAVAGDNALTRQILFVLPEIRATMLHEHVQFNEGAFIKEHLNALTGSMLALGMLLFNAARTAALHDMLFLGPHQFNFFLNCSQLYPS